MIPSRAARSSPTLHAVFDKGMSIDFDGSCLDHDLRLDLITYGNSFTPSVENVDLTPNALHRRNRHSWDFDCCIDHIKGSQQQQDSASSGCGFSADKESRAMECHGYMMMLHFGGLSGPKPQHICYRMPCNLSSFVRRASIIF